MTKRRQIPTKKCRLGPFRAEQVARTKSCLFTSIRKFSRAGKWQEKNENKTDLVHRKSFF